jgi:hypothetical protein
MFLAPVSFFCGASPHQHSPHKHAALAAAAVALRGTMAAMTVAMARRLLVPAGGDDRARAAHEIVGRWRRRTNV